MRNVTQIKVLPRLVYERIAAGEVVERPASVVKELVENSLDAHAERIEVELAAGGKRLIRVTDDGCGMSPADARTCFERHATSKIDTFEDLELLKTYGFRGEALPSIGAVAKIRLVTRFRGDERGTEVVYEGGRLVRCVEAGAPVGTDIVVRELFYNVPARRKFLKTDVGERRACVELVKRMALPNPRVAFHVLAGGKTQLAWAPADELQRCSEYFSSAADPLELTYSSPGVGRVHGALWHPNRADRANRSGILVFVNGRSVDNRVVTDAAAAACRGVGRPDRFPQAVLFLELSGKLVDVNVHPTKSEVKFADDAAVRKLVKAAVTRALAEAGVDLAAATPLGGGYEPAGPPDRRPSPAGGTEETGPAYNDTPDDVPFGVGDGRRPARVAPSRRPGRLERTGDAPAGQLRFSTEAARQLYERAPFEVRGQFADSFILVEHGDKLLVIDQHAAHERVIYEELQDNDAEHPAASQELLLPPLVRLSPDRAARLAGLLELLESYGFRVEVAGADAFRVLAVPQIIKTGEEQAVAEEVLAELGDVGEDKPLAELERLARATVACKAAVKAGEVLGREQMRNLIRRLLASPNRSTCPHGRPTTAELTEEQIRRWFRR